jgi:hypothetical protein
MGTFPYTLPVLATLFMMAGCVLILLSMLPLWDWAVGKLRLGAAVMLLMAITFGMAILL